MEIQIDIQMEMVDGGWRAPNTPNVLRTVADIYT